MNPFYRNLVSQPVVRRARGQEREREREMFFVLSIAVELLSGPSLFFIFIIWSKLVFAHIYIYTHIYTYAVESKLGPHFPFLFHFLFCKNRILPAERRRLLKTQEISHFLAIFGLFKVC